jgi:hypothetical protein
VRFVPSHAPVAEEFPPRLFTCEQCLQFLQSNQRTGYIPGLRLDLAQSRSNIAGRIRLGNGSPGVELAFCEWGGGGYFPSEYPIQIEQRVYGTP